MDTQSKMIMYESLLTTFEPCSIFWDSLGRSKNRCEAKTNHYNQVKLVQIRVALCKYSLSNCYNLLQLRFIYIHNAKVLKLAEN